MSQIPNLFPDESLEHELLDGATVLRRVLDSKKLNFSAMVEESSKEFESDLRIT